MYFPKEKVFFDILHLLAKFDCRPSSAKMGIWGHVTIILVYFWSSAILEGGFCMMWLQNRVFEAPQLSYPFIFGPSAALEGGFLALGPTCMYMWQWVPRVVWLSSPSRLLIRHMSMSCHFSLHALSQEPAAAPLVFFHRTSSPPPRSSCSATWACCCKATWFHRTCWRIHHREVRSSSQSPLLSSFMHHARVVLTNQRRRAFHWLAIAGIDDRGSMSFWIGMGR
jgi:hypothetical protein